MGIGRGERVAILTPNCVEYPILLMALFRIGAVAVPTGTRFPASPINALLNNINCRHGIASGEFHKSLSSDKIHWHKVDDLISAFTDSRSGFKGVPTKPDEMSLDQDATIIFTSGTSAQPKAVLHTLANHHYSASGSNRNIPFEPGDRWLLSLPLYHVGGLAILFRALVGGGAVVIPDHGDSLSDSISKFHPTHVSLVATQLYRLLEEGKVITQLQKMKAILLGGSSIPPNLIIRSHQHRLPLFTSYGSTEMASQITTTRPGDSLERLLTSGKLLPHRQLKISADGEILVKGETLFRGYVKGGEIERQLNGEGWFATGDLGKLDSDGYLTVTGRKDNMFISGGENIQPEEIERELCGIEGVTEAVVVPVADEEFGQRPAAFIEVEGDFPPRQFFETYLQDRIPRFKIPDRFFHMPKDTPMGGIKKDRRELKKIAADLVSGQS